MEDKKGFTLMELLVVISLVAILAALATSGLMRALKAGDRTKAVAQIRQIGIALMVYVADHDGNLPGPMKSGQGALYEPEATDQLAGALGPYLGVQEPETATVVPTFLPPAYVKAMSQVPAEEARPYVLNISASTTGGTIRPWGSAAAPVENPMRLLAVPTSTWALVDADQLNPQVQGQPWAGKTPNKIVHGSQRLALFFDGSAGPIDSSLLKKGGGPPPPPPPPPKS
jgi:prepilin-type N-terminal cleavage/methylation domain-containing protein